MEGYREQEGCHNCVYVKVESDYDSPDHFFCNIDKSIPKYNRADDNIWDDEKGGKRFYLGNLGPEKEELISNRLDIDTEWQKKHEVKTYGICDNHKNLDKPLEQ